MNYSKPKSIVESFLLDQLDDDLHSRTLSSTTSQLPGGAAAVEAAKAEIESISQSIETEITLPAETITYLTGHHIDELANRQGMAIIRGNPER